MCDGIHVGLNTGAGSWALGLFLSFVAVESDICSFVTPSAALSAAGFAAGLRRQSEVSVVLVSSSRSVRAEERAHVRGIAIDRETRASEGALRSRGCYTHRAEEPRVDDTRPRQSFEQHLDPPGEHRGVRRGGGYQARAGISQERGDRVEERRKRRGGSRRSARPMGAI